MTLERRELASRPWSKLRLPVAEASESLAFTMKRIVLSLCMTAFALTLTATQGAPPTPTTAQPNPVDPAIIAELKGDWKNALNSTLRIKSIDPSSGAIDGSYISPQGTNGTEYPLHGWVNTKAPDSTSQFPVVVISWSVRWGTIGSVTAWNGFYAALPKDGTSKTPTIVGQWLLSRPDGNYEWDHVLAGQDRFTKAP